MAKLRFILSVCCLFFIAFSHAQDTSWFTHGIAIAGVHHYGREALYRDQLAYQLYTNTLAKPAAGPLPAFLMAGAGK